MLELKMVTKKYGYLKAVDGVSFTVRAGESVGYLGPNGAGKSTTIKMLAGLLEPTEGEIFYNGRNVWKNLVWFKQRIGYVPEEPAIYSHMSAYDYLLMVGRLRGLEDSILKRKIMGFMEIFDLSGDVHSEIASFSKGMVQKVLISAALLHDPEVLLLDEPLSGLDVTTALVVRELVRRLSAEGKLVIYSSHILEIVEKVASRVIILYQGRVQADDSVENLRQLMKLPSLEDIFNQLVKHDDPQVLSSELVALMKKGSRD
ncbi:MAG: ABC transporter, ATP-binding protein [Candidatus Saccharicenans subterraneus]|uniref:ABC transporter, ATP-binding protein n=1 Tax=Candidatus Saccharicenans subterraneus TaxID=2508984 RepID=A0A3E2BMG1_9BACT|nr:MAG: ABC transporter, ATP-binding protein [Candidatus Saccharicenans subterraneum]